LLPARWRSASYLYPAKFSRTLPSSYPSSLAAQQTLPPAQRRCLTVTPLSAPVIIKDKDDIDEDNEKLVGFKVVYVFDLSQTDGEPLPKAPCWKSPEKNQELNDRLIQFAENKGIKVSVRKLSNGAQGVSKGGEVELDPTAALVPLFGQGAAMRDALLGRLAALPGALSFAAGWAWAALALATARHISASMFSGPKSHCSVSRLRLMS